MCDCEGIFLNGAFFLSPIIVRSIGIFAAALIESDRAMPLGLPELDGFEIDDDKDGETEALEIFLIRGSF